MPSEIEPADRLLAKQCREKRARGEKPLQNEVRALHKIEKAAQEQLAWQVYAKIPKRHWREMSGRQTKVINEQALRYGLPFGGAVINLPEVVSALHNFLAVNAKKLAAADDDDPLLAGVASPALEQYRRERTKLARMDRLEREQELLPRELVHECLMRVAYIIRAAGDTLARLHGNDAAEILTDALQDAQRDINTLCSPKHDSGTPPPGDP